MQTSRNHHHTEARPSNDSWGGSASSLLRGIGSLFDYVRRNPLKTIALAAVASVSARELLREEPVGALTADSSSFDAHQEMLPSGLNYAGLEGIDSLEVMAEDLGPRGLDADITFAKAFGIPRSGRVLYEPSAWDIKTTNDGGYVVVGYVDSFRAGGRSNYDALILKLDMKGNQTWAKTFKGTLAFSIQQAADDSYVLAGYTGSLFSTDNDAFVMKLDPNGNQVWAKAFGGTAGARAYGLQLTADGGCVLAGQIAGFGAGEWNALIMKLDLNGNQIWAKALGGNHSDYARSVQLTADGGYALAGYTNSFGAGNSDALVIKLDEEGNQVWARSFGGSRIDIAYHIQPIAGDGYVVAGYTRSFDRSPHVNVEHALIMKLDLNGNQAWVRTFGKSSNSARAYSIRQTVNDGYVVAGSIHPVSRASLIMKLDTSGHLVWSKTLKDSDSDSDSSVAYNIQLTADGGYIVAGDGEVDGFLDDHTLITKLNANGNLQDCQPPLIDMVERLISTNVQALNLTTTTISNFSTPVSGTLSSLNFSEPSFSIACASPEPLPSTVVAPSNSMTPAPSVSTIIVPSNSASSAPLPSSSSASSAGADPGGSNQSSGTGPDAAVVAGGTVGGIVVLGGIAAAFFLCYRKKKVAAQGVAEATNVELTEVDDGNGEHSVENPLSLAKY